MERNIVFSYELEEICVLRIPPPVFPVLSCIGCNRDIANRCIEPYIEDFVFITLLRYRNTPLKVTGYTSFLKAVPDPGVCDLHSILGPETIHRSLLHPSLKLRKGLWKVDVKMLCLLYYGSMAADGALWLNKLCRIQESSTLITLIPSGSCVSTVRTSTCYISVGKESLAFRTIQLLGFLLADVSVLIDLIEDVLDNLCLERCTCPSKIIEADIEPLVDFTMDGMISVTEFPWSHTLLKGPGLTGCAVFIGAADIEGFISF